MLLTVTKKVTLARWYQIGEGLELPSVTSVLEVKSKGPGLLKWACNVGYEASQQAMREGGVRGTYVHNFISSCISAKQIQDVPADCPEPYLGYVSSARKALEALGCCAGESRRWSEHQVTSLRYGYAGTLDYCGYIGDDDEPTIVDWKTSTQLYDEHKLQTAAYCIAFGESTGTDVSRRSIILLGKDGDYAQKVLPTGDLTSDFEGFRGALELFKWDQRKRYRETSPIKPPSKPKRGKREDANSREAGHQDVQAGA